MVLYKDGTAVTAKTEGVCALSPLTVNINMQDSLSRIRKEVVVGVVIQGEIMSMIQLADNILLVADGENDLLQVLEMMKDDGNK